VTRPSTRAFTTWWQFSPASGLLWRAVGRSHAANRRTGPRQLPPLSARCFDATRSKPGDVEALLRSLERVSASWSPELQPMNEFDSSAIIRDLEMPLDQLYYWDARAASWAQPVSPW